MSTERCPPVSAQPNTGYRLLRSTPQLRGGQHSCAGNGSFEGGGALATLGHIFGFGSTYEKTTVLVYGCKGRGTQRQGPFKHDTGRG